MLSSSTKEAIKQRSQLLSLFALHCGFSGKPYWAAIAVAVMALNESFAHSIHKGHNAFGERSSESLMHFS